MYSSSPLHFLVRGRTISIASQNKVLPFSSVPHFQHLLSSSVGRSAYFLITCTVFPSVWSAVRPTALGGPHLVGSVSAGKWERSYNGRIALPLFTSQRRFPVQLCTAESAPLATIFMVNNFPVPSFTCNPCFATPLLFLSPLLLPALYETLLVLLKDNIISALPTIN